ncbi:hypothetical protein BDF19DRAFT_420627 [Syncephalis fuscata]|nr:hypothetical protein BDF19DRAFT_420627 [Syncephalis fuscata]
MSSSQELVLFASSSRFIYQTIIDQPNHWERKYKRTFSLGERREQEWLTHYSQHINTTTKLKNLHRI